MNVTRRAMLHGAGALAALPMLPAGLRPAAAQEWPSRSIRLLVGTAPGGSPDVISRTIGEHLAKRLGQTVVVENQTSGAGAIAQHMTATAPPDGYTMMMMTAGYPPQMQLRKAAFDPLDGFSYVTMICGYPMTYTVRPDSPIKSFEDLLAQGKKNPGKLTYTINAMGSVHHVLTKWIESEAGVEMNAVAYRGSGPALTDVLGGRVDVMVEPATTSYPRVGAKQVRMLAHSGAANYPLLPGVQSVGEVVKGVEFMSWLGYVMPGKTPAPIVERMNSELRAVLKIPEVEKRFVEGGNLITPSSPQEMRAKVQREMELWGGIIKAAGIKPA